MEVLAGGNHIVTERLQPREYLQSLMEEALTCGLLHHEDMVKIQTEMLQILAQQTEKWTRGESSSVRVEVATELMTSVTFVLGVYLKSCPTPEWAVAQLKEEPLKVLFEKGLERVYKKIKTLKDLQKSVKDKLFETPNVFYRSTVVDGIDGFFKLYQPQFQAQEIHITADYPVFAGRPALDGIEFMEQYLHCIEAENSFCTLFSPDAVHHLLCGLTSDYRNIPMNLFSFVALAAFGLVWLGRNPRTLHLTGEDVEQLGWMLRDKSKQELEKKLENGILCMERELSLSDTTRAYLQFCLGKFAFEIENGVALGTLNRCFLISKGRNGDC